ncbi:MAG: outer membrane lipoprotein-sorting protein [Nevskiaceae bacterium]
MIAHRTFALAAGLALATLGGAAAAESPAKPAVAPAAKTVKDIRACMSDNLIKRGALRDMNLGIYDKEGKVRDLRMRLYWKPSKTGGTRVHLRIVEPPIMIGSSYLMLQEGPNEEVYFYLPGADRALRITGQNMSEPLWGTDFSYGEIKQVMGLLVTGKTRRLADAAVASRPSYVLETQTSMDETGYRKVVNYVDQASCVLLKSEFVANGDKPRKVLEGDLSSLLQADRYWTMLAYKMSDLSRGSYTQLSLSDLSVDERLSEKLFDPKVFYAQNPPL